MLGQITIYCINYAKPISCGIVTVCIMLNVSQNKSAHNTLIECCRSYYIDNFVMHELLMFFGSMTSPHCSSCWKWEIPLMTTDHSSEISKFNFLSIIIKIPSQPGFEPN